MRFLLVSMMLLFLPAGFVLSQHKPKVEKGTVEFKQGDQRNIPEMYRLKPHNFDYKLTFRQDYPISGFEIYHLTFPSPVTTPHKENNTVHAAYYKPKGKKKFPCVVVLHITGGDQSVSKTISSYLAKQGIGALFVQMAYYGPRRPPGSRLRMLSFDAVRTTKAVRQTVLDIRRAAAWLAAREEIDKDNIGVLGTSLGGFMAALSAEMEPKFQKVIVLLAGGGFVDGFYDHPKARPYVVTWELLGGTKDKAKKLIAPYDPLTCAANLKNRRLLMFSAKHDEIVPPKMAKALWKASGKQKIIWVDAGHYTAALYLFSTLPAVVRHIEAKNGE